MDECQEPKCRNPTYKSWGGRKVCQDHYEQYQDLQDKQMMDLRDNY